MDTADHCLSVMNSGVTGNQKNLNVEIRKHQRYSKINKFVTTDKFFKI